MRAPVATIGTLAVATLALRLRDPHQSGSWGYCPTALLGLSCPACGGLRAVNDLTHGDVAAAASSNLLLLVLAPFVVVGLAVWTLDRWRGVERGIPAPVQRWMWGIGVGVAIVFTIARNTPAGAWLAP